MQRARRDLIVLNLTPLALDAVAHARVFTENGAQFARVVHNRLLHVTQLIQGNRGGIEEIDGHRIIRGRCMNHLPPDFGGVKGDFGKLGGSGGEWFGHGF